MSFHGGIEIDGDEVRATVIDGSPKNYRVVDYVEGRITGETEEERSDSLREVLGSAFFAKDRSGLDVSVSVGADRAILREITVPYTKDEMIAKTIRYESESYIFSHSVDDLLIEFIKCNETEAGSRLILCGVEKKHFAKDLERLKAVSIDPVHAELNATALATTYLAAEPTGAEGSTLLVQIERDHTTFVLLTAGQITKVRSVWNVIHSRMPDAPLLPGSEWPGGGGDSVSAVDEVESAIEDRFAEIERSLGGLEPKPAETDLAASLESDRVPPAELSPSGDPPMFAIVSDEEYEAFSRTSGADGGAAKQAAPDQPTRDQSAQDPMAGGAGLALAVVGDPFERIILELERTFAGYLLGGSIDRLVVTGGEARAMDAVSRLSTHFDTEAVELPLDRVECAISGTTFDAFRESGAASLGLALRNIGLAATPFELRREEFRFERRFERLMPSLTLVSLLLALISLVWMVGEHRKATTLEQEVAILRADQASKFEKFFGVPSPGGPGTKDYHTAAKDQLKKLEGRQRGQNVSRMKQYAGAMELFDDFYAAIDRTRPLIYPTYSDFEFNPLKKKGTKSTVKFHVEKLEDVQAFAETYRNSTKFFDVYPSPQENKTQGGYDITLDLEYKLNQ